MFTKLNLTINPAIAMMVLKLKTLARLNGLMAALLTKKQPILKTNPAEKLKQSFGSIEAALAG